MICQLCKKETDKLYFILSGNVCKECSTENKNNDNEIYDDTDK